MKYLTYQRHGAPRPGLLLDDRHIVDIPRLCRQMKVRPASTLLSVIERGPDLWSILEGAVASEDPASLPVIPFDEVRLCAPLSRVPKMHCYSVYEAHMQRSLEAVLAMRVHPWLARLARRGGLIRLPKSWYQKPTYYKGNPTSLIGPDDELPYPKHTEMLDYEMELALIVGQRGMDIEPGDARGYIFGYTIFNDFSARDVLIRELLRGRVGPLKGKDFEYGNAIGPWIVTPDELGDPHGIDMRVWVNGELAGAASTSGMSHTIDALLVESSRTEALVPGQLIATGVPAGGCGLESQRFLKPGDRVRIEIDGIGRLENRIVASEPERMQEVSDAA
ncbi:MAG: fumarylacetoacetate hydrolase family protein [Candidatus Dadabacteria bacterium]|nr:MAG: fumarylacetoacetate hydrolase family protein [Candidatus Dadabacteria bacterium]